MKIVVFGLSVTSTWGNGHGTTFVRFSARCISVGIRFVSRKMFSGTPQIATCHIRRFAMSGSIKIGTIPAFDVSWETPRSPLSVPTFPMAFSRSTRLRRPMYQSRAFYDIDTPITMATLREHGRADYVDAVQIPLLNIYFKFTGDPMLREIDRISERDMHGFIARSIRRDTGVSL